MRYAPYLYAKEGIEGDRKDPVTDERWPCETLRFGELINSLLYPELRGGQTMLHVS